MNMASLATQQTSTSIRMTVSVVVVLPILFIYPMFQKHFVKGIMMGAVKDDVFDPGKFYKGTSLIKGGTKT